MEGPDGQVASRWSLRVNPSSGNLHPTEGYLVCGPAAGLAEFPGIYHYAPFEHGLELRRPLDRRRMADPFAASFAGGLPPRIDIHLLAGVLEVRRESLSLLPARRGHAIGAVAISAGSLGWRTRLLERVSTAALERLLGID